MSSYTTWRPRWSIQSNNDPAIHEKTFAFWVYRRRCSRFRPLNTDPPVTALQDFAIREAVRGLGDGASMVRALVVNGFMAAPEWKPLNGDLLASGEQVGPSPLDAFRRALSICLATAPSVEDIPTLPPLPWYTPPIKAPRSSAAIHMSLPRDCVLPTPGVRGEYALASSLVIELQPPSQPPTAPPTASRRRSKKRARSPSPHPSGDESDDTSALQSVQCGIDGCDVSLTGPDDAGTWRSHYEAAHGLSKELWTPQKCPHDECVGNPDSKSIDIWPSYLRHVKTKHFTPPEGDIKCPKCGKEFSRPDALIRHIRRKDHKKPTQISKDKAKAKATKSSRTKVSSSSKTATNRARGPARKKPLLTRHEKENDYPASAGARSSRGGSSKGVRLDVVDEDDDSDDDYHP